jgi:hypothetical protein
MSQPKEPQLTPQQTLACYFSRQPSAATSCRFIYHMNVFHSSDRPHVLHSEGGKWHTTAVENSKYPVPLRCCHCTLGTTYRLKSVRSVRTWKPSITQRYPSAELAYSRQALRTLKASHLVNKFSASDGAHGLITTSTTHHCTPSSAT